MDDWCGDVFSFCKPVAKTAEDRVALVRAVVGSSGKFFFGSDSAPHPVESKKGDGNTAAGCFTQPWCTSLVIGALEEGLRNGWIEDKEVTRQSIEGFLSSYGRTFYQLDQPSESFNSGIRLERRDEVIPNQIVSHNGTIKVIPFGRGKKVMSIVWRS